MCLCCGGTSSDSTTIKEAVFCNFDLTYLPCCLQPPAPIMSDEGGSLEGREWHHFDVQHGGSKRLLVEEELG